VTAPSSGTSERRREREAAEKGEERRVRLSDEDVAHAGDPGEITRG